MPIEYFEHPEMPGKKMFQCTALRASLRVDACKGMWELANGRGQGKEGRSQCKQCLVGAAHAGAQDIAVNVIRGTNTCTRCNRPDMRIIGGTVCVCCKNREYEWVKGKNGRGKFPVTHPQLDRRAARYVVAGVTKVIARPLTASMDELVVELLRDSDKRVVFGFGRGKTLARQGSLL